MAFAKNMKMSKLKITLILLITLAIGLCFSIKSERYRTYQGYNNYYAYKVVKAYRIGGIELYSIGEFAVYQSEVIPLIDSLPEPLTAKSKQKRLLGYLIGGSDKYNLGYSDYRQERCVALLRSIAETEIVEDK